MSDVLYQDPGWTNRKDGENDDFTGLEYSDLDAINNWVVQLRFNRVNDAKDYCGNGSFLNVPNYPEKHVIITCAHNLIHSGNRSLNLEVHYNNPFDIDPVDPAKVVFADPSKPAIIVVPVENNQDNVYICKEYTGAGTKDPAVDYGVILIPRTSIHTPHGFGFSLKLSFRSSFNGNSHVSGFKNLPKGTRKPLRPITSSGIGITYKNGRFIEYRAKTEPGISGSPVWVEFNKFIAIVGIHNQGIQGVGRGALLTLDILRDIFQWISPDIMRPSVEIQVFNGQTKKARQKKPPTATIPDRGLFLSFKTSATFGRVRLGSGTKFDWIPAEVDSNNLIQYGLLSVDDPKRWLQFDLDAPKYQGVRLTDTINRRGCIFRNFETKDENGNDALWMKIGIDTGTLNPMNDQPVCVQIKMNGSHIKENNENRESSEVLLVTCGEPGSKDAFNKIVLKGS